MSADDLWNLSRDAAKLRDGMATKGTRLLWVFLAPTDLPYGSFLFFEVVIKLRCKKLQRATEAFVPSRFFWPWDTGVNLKIRPGYKAQGLSHEKPRWEDRKKCLRNVRKCLWSLWTSYALRCELQSRILLCSVLFDLFPVDLCRWVTKICVLLWAFKMAAEFVNYKCLSFAQGCITISLVSDEDLI